MPKAPKGGPLYHTTHTHYGLRHFKEVSERLKRARAAASGRAYADLMEAAFEMMDAATYRSRTARRYAIQTAERAMAEHAVDA